MPYDIRIIRGREFLRLDAYGQVDLESSRILLGDAIWACVHGKVGRVLIDVREAMGTTLTVPQLAMLAGVCQQISPPPDVHKIAILNRPKDDFDRAAFLAAEAQQVGWNLRAFRDFEAAFNWLAL